MSNKVGFFYSGAIHKNGKDIFLSGAIDIEVKDGDNGVSILNMLFKSVSDKTGEDEKHIYIKQFNRIVG